MLNNNDDIKLDGYLNANGLFDDKSFHLIKHGLKCTEAERQQGFKMCHTITHCSTFIIDLEIGIGKSLDYRLSL